VELVIGADVSVVTRALVGYGDASRKVLTLIIAQRIEEMVHPNPEVD
jgi:hypothetical protein